RVAIADHRLALFVPGRPVAARAGLHDPLLGAGIAALADAHGPPRGSAEVTRLGIDDRPAGDRAAGHGAGRRKDALARSVQVSTAGCRRLHDRADSDGWSLVRSLGGDAAGDRAEHESGARRVPDGIYRLVGYH